MEKKVMIEISFYDFQLMESLKSFIFGAAMMATSDSAERATMSQISTMYSNAISKTIYEAAVAFGIEEK